jgi:pyruvate dehydrogenase E1 component
MMERRRGLAGSVPERVERSRTFAIPARDTTSPFAEVFQGTGEKVQASTTTAFARLLRNLLRDPALGNRIVPIIPDEARTFGLDALFRDYKIYAPFGQRYEPVDAALLLSYREATNGRILEEGINEAGSMASFTAAGTAYATWGQPMIPFFIFYSMFGSSASATSSGPSATSAARASCSARPRGAPPSPARACSTATVTARCSRRWCRTAACTTPRSPTRWR